MRLSDERTRQIENCFVLLLSFVLTRFHFFSVCVTAKETSFHELFVAIRSSSLRLKVFYVSSVGKIINDLMI